MEIDAMTGEVLGEDAALVPVEVTGALALAKTELESQIDAAHRHPRSVRKFLQDATTMATLDETTAASCIYSMPRGGKSLVGPSIRCAEICLAAWGNCHAAARVVAIEDKEVVAQGTCWDTQSNTRITVENRRRITHKNGERYNDDMITMTGNAAASIALRNAIFRVVPRAYVDQVYQAARKVAVGNADTLVDRRGKILDRLAKMGATQERVLAALDKRGIEDVGLEELALLIGWGTAIKDGEKKLDEVFPEVKAPVPEVEGRRMALGKKAEKQPEEKQP